MHFPFGDICKMCFQHEILQHHSTWPRNCNCSTPPPDPLRMIDMSIAGDVFPRGISPHLLQIYRAVICARTSAAREPPKRPKHHRIFTSKERQEVTRGPVSCSSPARGRLKLQNTTVSPYLRSPAWPVMPRCPRTRSPSFLKRQVVCFRRPHRRCD